MLREIVEALEVLTAEHLLVLVLEDLHWSDPSTLAFLAMVARRPEPAHLLLVGTYRPEEVAHPTHPLQVMAQDLRRRQQGVEVPLRFFSPEMVTAYLKARFPGLLLPAAWVDDLHQRTNGNPLFLRTFIDALVQQGAIRRSDRGWEVTMGLDVLTMSIPDSLRHLVEWQFAQLRPEEQAIVEIASVAGDHSRTLWSQLARTSLRQRVRCSVPRSLVKDGFSILAVRHGGQMVRSPNDMGSFTPSIRK